MIARLFLALSVLLLPAATAAADEPLSVRAGEHGDFSRLVIAKAPADWKIATSDRKIEVTFPSKDYDFDLSDILDKRKAHRVLSARIVDTDKTRALVLSLTCDCPVRTSKSADDAVVIDIFNEAPTPLTEPEYEPERPISLDARNSSPSTPENMRAARDRMIALLAEARHQGVVQLKTDEERNAPDLPQQQTTQPTTSATQVAHHPDAARAEAENKSPLNPQVAPLADHSLSTPNEDDALADAPTHADSAPTPLLSEAQNGADCADPSLFNDVADEDRAVDYSSIEKLRHRFGLSDDEDERQTIASGLVLSYIHLGFFEEASAIATAQSRSEDPNMLFAGALADIASGSKSRAAHTLAPHQKCGAFAELAYAAATRTDDDSVAPMQTAHISALRPITPALRAPLAEELGLKAIELGDMTIAKEFYDLARSARGRERSPALAIMENALAAQRSSAAASQEEGPHNPTQQPGAAPMISEELKEIAQTPGPLQAKALAILADDYEKRATAAYDGLLDDIAAQSSRKNSSLSEARSSFTGAKALVGAGRLREGVAVLESAARTAPRAGEASRALAQSLILSALLEDDKTRLDAVSTFFHYREFLDTQDNGDLNIAVARELAAYGANALVDEALSGAPDGLRGQVDVIKAQSHLNSGDSHGALDIAENGDVSTELSLIAVKAHERLNNRAGTVVTLKSAMRAGPAEAEFTHAAWRAEDWALAIETFTAVPQKDRNAAAASRAALAALNAGAATLPAAARESLAKDPTALAALAHMFTPAPVINIRAINLLSEFSKGVKKETDFMETGLVSGGDGK